MQQRSRRVIPIPHWLLDLRRRCAELIGIADERLAECLLSRYPPSATIGWHRDAPMFGDVVGVSLGFAFCSGSSAARVVSGASSSRSSSRDPRMY
jgi:alkylated DNA repair dioxygenase AlkB